MAVPGLAHWISTMTDVGAQSAPTVMRRDNVVFLEPTTIFFQTDSRRRAKKLYGSRLRTAEPH